MNFLIFIGGAVLFCVFAAGVAYLVEKLAKRLNFDATNHKD